MNARIKEDYTMRERCHIIQLTNKLIQFHIDHENVDSSFQKPTRVQLKSIEKYLDRVKKLLNESVPKKLNAPSSKGQMYNSMMKQDGIIGGSPVFCRVLPTNIEDIENEGNFATFGRQAGKCFKRTSYGLYQSFNQFRYY